MQFHTSAVLSTNVIGCWDTYLLWRQRRSYNNETVPAALKSVISSDDFAKAQAYGRDKTRFAIVEHVTDLVQSNLSLLCRIPAKLYSWTATATGLSLGSFTHCLTFSVVSDVLSTLVGLPLSYYFTFVVEEKHGFNRMTRKEFFLDAVKSFLLRVFLLYPIQTGMIQWVVRKFGEAFPMYFFAAAGALLIAFTFIFPTVIQPIFNKFSDLDPQCQLYDKITTLAARVSFPLTKVYTVDGSRRSSHSNAYMYGFWKNKRIVLYDTLLEQLGSDDEQIIAVLCHELGHWKHRHVQRNVTIALGQILAYSYGAKTVIFNENMYRQFGFVNMDPVIGFEIYSQVFLAPLSTALGYGMNYMIRTCEFEADRFAVSMGYGQKLKDALVTMVKENKSGLTPDPLYSTLSYSHPPTMERLAAIDASVAALTAAKSKSH